MEWQPQLIPQYQYPHFPASLALSFEILAQSIDNQTNTLKLLVWDPFDYTAWQAVSHHYRDNISLVMTPRTALCETIKSIYGVGAETFEEIIAQRDLRFVKPKEDVNVLDEESSEASVMKFVNQILCEGIERGATDIHFEPLGNDLRIRYRIDGILEEAPVPSQINLLQDSVISRLKIMASLDIAERRLPQDGRISLEHQRRLLDVRVATIPSVNGENISLRLLGQEKFNFSRLGLELELEQKIRALISSPNGILLMTGPTGCGKSTSLYTFLSSLNVVERRIVTIEDPVEYKLPGVIQIAVKPEINLSFAHALRSILRGDPNIIMIGEMRDTETADIAIRAALTGHLVFSTLHTNDAIGGIMRLLDMKIEPFLVASSVRAFIAQRLVRKLCPFCSEDTKISLDELKYRGFPIEHLHLVRQAKGCHKCRKQGYIGRLAIMEICMMTHQLQELIQKQATPLELLEQANKDGMISLQQDGWKKVIQGLTSVEEVVRVTATELAILDE